MSQVTFNRNSNKEFAQGIDTRHGRVDKKLHTEKALIAVAFNIDIKLISVIRYHH